MERELTRVLATTVIYRDVPGSRIPGGSEDVMLDLAVRQLVKLYQAKSEAVEEAAQKSAKL